MRQTKIAIWLYRAVRLRRAARYSLNLELRFLKPVLYFILMLQGLCLFPTMSRAAETHVGWYTFTSENGLTGNIVQALWEDPQGHIWFGSENGASRYDGLHWEQYRATPDGLIDNNVWAIAGDVSSVWFATSNGVSRLLNARWTSYSMRDGLPNNDVRALAISNDGSVWAGTFGGGIARLLPAASRWETIRLPFNIRSNDLIVSAIWEAPNGDIWFSTNGIGALRLRAGRWESFNFRQANRNTVWAVGGSTEHIWLATFRGIVEIKADDSISVMRASVDGIVLDETEVLAVDAAADGAVWFGTRSHGVLRFFNGVWQHFSESDGLSRSYVQSVLVDHSGRVWLGTRGGGVTMRDPRPPAVDTLDVQLGTQDISTGEELTLDGAALRFDQNNLALSFSAPMAWLPTQVVCFRYWLNREDGTAQVQPRVVQSVAAQISLAKSNLQDFIGLPAGSYSLHVVPLIGEFPGPERQYAFRIEGVPPHVSADDISIWAGDVVLPRGTTLTNSLFETRRIVRLQFVPAQLSQQNIAARYEYRVLEIQEGWQPINGNQAQIELPEGTHQIEVQALDDRGNHSTPVMLTVVVPGPLWITILLALAAVLIPGVAGGAISVWWYRRWAQRQALLRAVRGHLIPYDVGPLINTPERYIGRRHVLDTILGRIEHNSFYVYGERRIGKTSLLAQLKQLLEQRNMLSTQREYISVFRNIQDLPQEHFWLTLMRSIADSFDPQPVLSADHQSGQHYTDLDAQDDFELLIKHAQQLFTPRKPLFVLLIDEIDTIERYDPIIRQRLRAFCQHMQEHLQVVLVGVAAPRASVGDTSPWSNIFAPLALGPIDLQDTLYLIRSYNHNPYSYTAEAEQELITVGDRKPFDTQWLCAEAVKTMLAAGRMRVEHGDVLQATKILARERRREYTAFWQQAPAALQDNLRQVLSDGGRLATDRVAFGYYDQLFESGLALSDGDEYRLSYLFQDWLRETLC